MITLNPPFADLDVNDKLAFSFVAFPEKLFSLIPNVSV